MATARSPESSPIPPRSTFSNPPRRPEWTFSCAPPAPSTFVDLEQLASEPYTSFVYGNGADARKASLEMLERGVGEFAPPFGRALENGDGETIGIVAGPLSRTELARARLQAAQVAGELGLLDAGLAARGRLARDTLLALTDDDQYLSRIAVHASARGRGAARVLLESFLSAARARGGRRAVLEVSPMHAGAIGLYESFGFVTLCERRADDPASGRSLVYRHMALTLPERAQ